jgi:hypothetical protein
MRNTKFDTRNPKLNTYGAIELKIQEEGYRSPEGLLKDG